MTWRGSSIGLRWLAEELASPAFDLINGDTILLVGGYTALWVSYGRSFLL